MTQARGPHGVQSLRYLECLEFLGLGSRGGGGGGGGGNVRAGFRV